jgi:hypothetical protein
MNPSKVADSSYINYVIAAHMETHPFKQDPDAPLWLTTCMSRLNQPLSWEGMSRMIKITAKRADIKKKRIHG